MRQIGTEFVSNLTQEGERMARVEKLPSGSYRVRIYSHTDKDGKKIYRSFVDKDKQKVKKMAHEFEDHKVEALSGEITVARCIDDYISSKTGVLSPSTIKGYRQIQKKYFDSINEMYVSRITSKDIQYLVSELSQTRSPKTVTNIYALLMSALDQVSDRKFKVTLPVRTKPAYQIPDDEDVIRLIEEAPEDIKLCIVLAAICAMRRGEIMALKYGDILREFESIYIHADMVQNEQKEWVYKPMPKTAAGIRRIKVSKNLISMIPDGDPEEFIFKMNPGTMSHKWHVLKNRLGIDCRFHDLRHYSTSVRGYLGIPAKETQAVGGWSSLKMIQEVYDNRIESKSIKYTKMANDYFDEKILKTKEQA